MSSLWIKTILLASATTSLYCISAFKHETHAEKTTGQSTSPVSFVESLHGTRCSPTCQHAKSYLAWLLVCAARRGNKAQFVFWLFSPFGAARPGLLQSASPLISTCAQADGNVLQRGLRQGRHPNKTICLRRERSQSERSNSGDPTFRRGKEPFFLKSDL